MTETMKASIASIVGEYSPNRRRTQRVKIAMPVVVRINKANGTYVEEATETAVVNAHGCLVRLGIPVERGQQIQIINANSTEAQTCSVVSTGQFVDGKTEVGLEFDESAPRFWRIIFPPEDWNPADRKLPSTPAAPIVSQSK